MKSLIIAAIVLSLLCGVLLAEIPQMISYQGKVSDSGGTPVADGTYTMRFMIYDATTAGTVLWDSGDQSVTVNGGVFSVLLGDSPQPAMMLDFSEDYWLEVVVGGDTQVPRVKMASVGYAYMASGLVPGTEVSGSVTSGTFAAIKGTNTATTGIAYGVCGLGFSAGGYFESASPFGHGVCGQATATSGVTYGGYFESASTDGRAVLGRADASSGVTYGVYGISTSSSGRGVRGEAEAAVGTTYGGYFKSSSAAGTGVYGEATATLGTTYGVYGQISSTDGSGVYGRATATSGTSFGVYALSSSTEGGGMYGVALASTGFTRGVYGFNYSTEGEGVFGYAAASSGTTYGAHGASASTDGRGVFGYASNPTGNGQGVRGESVSSTNGVGVYGLGSSTTGQNYGVFGRSFSPSGYGVYYAGGLAGSGTKSCVVKTSKGPTLLYCQESPENWFEDFGEGLLVNGRCHVELDPLFLETVTIDAANPMKVFVELDGRCHGVFVERGSTSFDVIEQDDGTSNVGFCFRVVAKRKGFEEKRLDYCKAAETDSYLYHELREKELRELEEERARMEEERVWMETERSRREEERGRVNPSG